MKMEISRMIADILPLSAGSVGGVSLIFLQNSRGCLYGEKDNGFSLNMIHLRCL